ncbi:DUF3810 domain-containing protein [Bacteroides sp. OttesenSCG-928-J23]|nr:DUF3810 domain-containing protein [Bacteroides sp. OttesenSCG-928-J23]
MKINIPEIKIKTSVVIRYSLLALVLMVVCLVQFVPALGEGYARLLYPYISLALSTVSGVLPFSLGDLFIFLSIVGILLYPLYARLRRKTKWKNILLHTVTYLAWVYVWFYLAWGLNYSQPHFYQRTGIPYVAYTEENFKHFVDDYVAQLNSCYVPITEVDKQVIHEEIIRQYRMISTELAVHPPINTPQVKTMMFTPLFSKMAITGYMGPFFCEFNLNGDLLPTQYADTYAHELAHLLGITSEAEANFYAYQTCTRSEVPDIRFSGYFSVLNHVLGNARRLLTEEEYKAVLSSIRPEVIEQAITEREYWMAKYSSTISDIQSWVYDLYLKGNKIESGRKNYSEVVGLLISWWSIKQKDIQ